MKEQYFKKQGSLKPGDEQKAVTEAEKIIGIETHNTKLLSDPPITKELMAALYKRHPRSTEEELAVAEAEKMFADTKGRLQNPETYRKSLPPQEQLPELEHQINKLWLLMYAEFDTGRTNPQRLIQWLKLQQEFAEANQRITPNPDLAGEAKFYSDILRGGNARKAGYCYLMEAEAAEEAGTMALENNPKYKGAQKQARIWQNMGNAWSEYPEQNKSVNTG